MSRYLIRGCTSAIIISARAARAFNATFDSFIHQDFRPSYAESPSTFSIYHSKRLKAAQDCLGRGHKSRHRKLHFVVPIKVGG